MEEIGNENSNSIYEYQPDPSHPKPSPDAQKEDRLRYIRLKYEELLFADKTKVARQDAASTKQLQVRWIVCLPLTSLSFIQCIDGHIVLCQMRLYKEGFLTKQGNTVKSWKKRWFVCKVSDEKATLTYWRQRGVSVTAVASRER